MNMDTERSRIALALALTLALAAPLALAADPAPAAQSAAEPATGPGGMMGMGGGMGSGKMGKRCRMHGMMGGMGAMLHMPRLPPGNDKLQMQMEAEILQKIGEIQAKYAAQLP